MEPFTLHLGEVAKDLFFDSMQSRKRAIIQPEKKLEKYFG
jgi:hypothetical protein